MLVSSKLLLPENGAGVNTIRTEVRFHFPSPAPGGQATGRQYGLGKPQSGLAAGSHRA